MKENIFRNKDRVLIGKGCADMGLSQQEQVHSTHIRSIIASNANTKSNKCSAMVAMHGMEGKEKSYERVSTH
jgi:hypothetical protein